MKTLNIIGSGRVGRACGRMWAAAGCFEIGDVLTRSLASAGEAVKFIGGGRAVHDVSVMRTADVWMIATRDDAIEPVAAALAASGRVTPDDVVFHVSGATPSTALGPLRAQGALIASVHPIKTFTDPALAVRTFRGTYCGAEGDREALRVLRPAFEAIGAVVFEITPGLKPVYHAAGVFSCNYLAALVEVALRAHEQAGIPREVSLRALEPLVRETVDAVFAQGPARALTGPVSRGDAATVERQLAALAARDPALASLYRGLGAIAVDLAERDGRLFGEPAKRLRQLLGL